MRLAWLLSGFGLFALRRTVTHRRAAVSLVVGGVAILLVAGCSPTVASVTTTEPQTFERVVWETTIVQVTRAGDDGVFDAFNDQELIEFHYSICESVAAADDPQDWMATIVEGDDLEEVQRMAYVVAALHVPPGCKTVEQRAALNVAYDFVMGSTDA